MNIPIYIDKLYKNDLKNEPCSVAIPFAKGQLGETEVKQLGIFDEKGELPSFSWPSSTWPDGSIKYLFTRFLVDLPGNQAKVLHLKKREESVRAGRQLIEASEDGFVVDTGSLQFQVSNSDNSLFDYLKLGGHTYQASQFVGPVLKIQGEEMAVSIDSWKITENSEVCGILEGSGGYSEGYRITVRITAYYGKDYLDIAFRLFNCTEEELIPDSWNLYIKRTVDSALTDELSQEFQGNQDSTGCGDMNESGFDAATLTFQTTGIGELSDIEQQIREKSQSKIRTLTGISNYKTRFVISGEGQMVSNTVTAQMLKGEANEHFAEVLYGTFMADVCDEEGGVCATIFQAQQNFPKAIKACREGICIYLIPEGEEKVSFASGMAREQRVQLHFHEEKETIEELDNRSLIYQMPVIPYVEPKLFGEAKVFPNIVTDFEKANDDVELALIARADQHGRAYGMMNWGDFPDSNYTAQGRGGGRLVWTNNEYDYPHAMFMMYARTGERRFLDYGKVSANHWMDVDVCHFSTNPLNIGGQWEHTAGHNGGNFAKTGVKGVMVCSHEWVEGLLDYWHFTGDRRALDTALDIGENVRRLLDTPMYQKPGEANARETGWALRSLTALYVETHEDKWIEKCNWIVEQFSLWKDKYGAWLAPYTDNTVIRVGFMISVAVGSLMRYYREFPDEKIKDLIISAVDDLVENELNPYGIFYYKDLPSLRRNGQNTLLLESLYIAYELTGDVKYLKAGLRTFNVNIKAGASYESTKRIEEDAVLVGKTSPKSFAQSFLPLVQFYNAVLQENLI